jgi:hypothetical protein
MRGEFSVRLKRIVVIISVLLFGFVLYMSVSAQAVSIGRMPDLIPEIDATKPNKSRRTNDVVYFLEGVRYREVVNVRVGPTIQQMLPESALQ